MLQITLVALLISSAAVAGERRDEEPRLAALALPTGARADWQQWDLFLTNVVKKLGEDFQPGVRAQLGETFLDAHYRLVQALRAGTDDPVP